MSALTASCGLTRDDLLKFHLFKDNYCMAMVKGVAEATSASSYETNYESFRKKVLRRDRLLVCGNDQLPTVIECQICTEKTLIIEAAHILDFSQIEALCAQYWADHENFPISFNSTENGMLVCKTCQGDYDSPQNFIQLKGDGTLIFSADALTVSKYKKLHDSGAKVTFAASIGIKDYPTSKFIEWAARQNRIGKKRMVEEEKRLTEEACGEDVPKSKKVNRRHQH